MKCTHRFIRKYLHTINEEEPERIFTTSRICMPHRCIHDEKLQTPEERKLLLRLHDEVIVLKNEIQGKYKMAPYTPPNTHYSQLDVSAYSEEDIFKFIGQGGKRFYWLTKFLDLAYLWYDKKRRVIEIWGPFESLQNFQSHHVIECELDFACNKT